MGQMLDVSRLDPRCEFTVPEGNDRPVAPRRLNPHVPVVSALSTHVQDPSDRLRGTDPSIWD